MSAEKGRETITGPRQYFRTEVDTITPVPAPFTVFISDHCGCEYRTTVSADSSLEAARKAAEFFNDPSWQGPKPGANTVLRIKPAEGEVARVSVREALSKTEA